MIIKKILILVCIWLGPLGCTFAMANSPVKEVVSDTLRITQAGFQATKAEIEGGVVTAYSKQHIQSLGQGRFQIKRHIIFAILNAQSADAFSKFSFPYNAYFNDFKLEFARVLTQEGSIHVPEQDAIKETDAQDFSDQRYINFALPAVQEGAFIEIAYTRTFNKPYLDDYWWTSAHFSYLHGKNLLRIPATRTSIIQVDTKAAETMQFDLRNAEQAILQQDGKSYIWTYSNIPEIWPEPYVNDFYEKIPGLELSTLPSWEPIDTWGTETFLKLAVADDGIAALASQIVGAETDKAARIKSLFAWMQKNIRYISADLNRGGLIPHAPADVLRNRYGDCKDQSVLLITLLKALGIDAFPALISPLPRKQPNLRQPDQSFSHMIVYIPMEDGEIWLDPSIPNNSYLHLPWPLKNVKAFVINSQGGQLLKTPASHIGENRVELFSKLSPGKDDEVMIADVSAKLYGDFSLAFRSGQLPSAEIKKIWEQIFRQIYSKATISSIETENAADSHLATAKLSFEREFDNHEAGKKYLISGGIRQSLSSFTYLMTLPSPADRKYDFSLNFPFKIDYHYQLAFPRNQYKNEVLTEPVSSKTQYFSVDTSLKYSNNGISVRSEFTLEDPAIPVSDYKEFYKSLQSGIQHSNWVAIFVRQSQDTAGSTNKNDGPLAKIDELLNAMNYDDAYEALQAYLTKYPASGEAYYKLGIAQGWRDEYEASEKSLQKAKSLGYQPEY